MIKNKTIFNEIKEYSVKPQLYESGNIKLWEDSHISKGMLKAHINPNIDAESRNHNFID